MSERFSISPHPPPSKTSTTAASPCICPVCGGRLHLTLSGVPDSVTSEAFDIHSCESCGLGITVPQPPDLAPYYKNYYGQRHGFTATFRAKRRLALVAKVTGRKRGRLLDIGCGDGYFLSLARHTGFAVTGTERNPEPARNRGLEIFESLDECRQAGPFDCITLWHSLEHMEDPRSVLASAKALLQPAGHLVIAVPDAGGAQARLFGRHWLHLDVPRHLYHFTWKSMKHLVAAEKLQIVKAWHQEFEYDVIGCAQSSLNALGTRRNAFLESLMGRNAGNSTAKKALLSLSGTLLCGLSTPFTSFCAFVRSGGTLVVAAQNQTGHQQTPKGNSHH